MSNTLTMILVLGGTLVVGMALLYASLLEKQPRMGSGKRRAEEATAAVMAARDPDSPDR